MLLPPVSSGVIVVVEPDILCCGFSGSAVEEDIQDPSASGLRTGFAAAWPRDSLFWPLELVRGGIAFGERNSSFSVCCCGGDDDGRGGEDVDMMFRGAGFADLGSVFFMYSWDAYACRGLRGGARLGVRLFSLLRCLKTDTMMMV